MASATRLLDSGGPDTVTLREVGRMTGVSHMAPYKHFADKEALLAAVAARELDRLRTMIATASATAPAPSAALHDVLHSYVRWALEHPARFKLVFGDWSHDHEDLGRAAGATRAALVAVVSDAQRVGFLPGGPPERHAALVQALAHGAIDLSLSGHLARDGKGRAAPEEVVDDLVDLLRAAADATEGRRGPAAAERD